MFRLNIARDCEASISSLLPGWIHRDIHEHRCHGSGIKQNRRWSKASYLLINKKHREKELTEVFTG